MEQNVATKHIANTAIDSNISIIPLYYDMVLTLTILSNDLDN